MKDVVTTPTIPQSRGDQPADPPGGSQVMPRKGLTLSQPGRRMSQGDLTAVHMDACKGGRFIPSLPLQLHIPQARSSGLVQLPTDGKIRCGWRRVGLS